jgi:hypothetical protein
MRLEKLTAVPLIFLLVGSAFAGDPDVKKGKIEITSAMEDSDGHMIIQFKNESGFNHKPGFYGDANGLFQLTSTGYAGSNSSYTQTFEDPRLERDGRINYAAGKDIMSPGDTYDVKCGDKTTTYHPMSEEKKQKILESVRSGKTSLTSLPEETRKTVYLYKRSGNSKQHVYVDVPKYDYEYENFRLFVGEPGEMNERKIKKVNASRGTTEIITEFDEVLFIPSPGSRDSTPKWNKTYPLESLDKDRFDVASLGIAGIPSETPSLHTPCDRHFPNISTGKASKSEKSGSGKKSRQGN